MPMEVTRDEVQRLLAAGAQLVDVLLADEYTAEHIAGAVNLPHCLRSPPMTSSAGPTQRYRLQHA